MTRKLGGGAGFERPEKVRGLGRVQLLHKDIYTKNIDHYGLF
jgi:hypothetical protein